ncbi:MAG: Blue-light-activated protein [Deltaproteobacteria bacterium ADurb.Bin510]|nr:MAG: Blue-light-activated protein [Deltaproteobacteria bacterium ADurb.Bin510]
MVEATISPMLDTKGTAIRYIIVMRDITHELDLERQLQQAHKMEALGTLAGGIAHDFNNILTPIIGYAEICREEATSESQREYLDEILKAATRARDMVSHIQIFSRQPSQETVIIKLQPLINEAIKLIRASIPSSIIIQSDISPECGPVLANPDQIQQIVMNLCTNAYHAMELGGGTLNIELKRLPAQSTQAARLICLRVSDTGCGIDPAIIDRIFDPYFTTKEIGKGSGMGLAIVHGIVERAGGTIRVESTPGLGSSFEVILPEASTETVQSDNHSAGDTELTGNERILLADDEAAIARLVKQILSKLGYSVTEATSGQEALAIFKQSPQAFDLLITDMAMPGMTGTALIKAVHAIRADLPVIVCSGFSEENDLNQAEASGIKAVIMKPIVKNELLQAVRRALD